MCQSAAVHTLCGTLGGIHSPNFLALNLGSTTVSPARRMCRVSGFDHGAGHPLLLLYDTKISRGENINNFNSLDYDPFIVSISLF